MNKYKYSVKIKIYSNMFHLVMNKLVEMGYSRLQLMLFEKKDTILYLYCYIDGKITWSREEDHFNKNKTKQIYLSDIGLTTKIDIYDIY